MIHDHSSDDFQASYTINGITYPFPSSVGIHPQPSCWSDIGIAGFQTVLDSQAHLIRRLIWLLVLTTCFTLMLLQTRDRLNYYLTRPVSTTVRFIRNDSLMFPSITLCPYRDTLTRDTSHLDLVKLQSLYEVHFPDGKQFGDPVDAMYKLADVYDVVTLWKLAGWELEDDVTSCLQARVNCTENGKIMRIFTILGYCLHFPGLPVTVSGQFYGFNIKLCKKTIMRIIQTLYRSCFKLK
ncbi:acid-sensing ion channel 1B-like [Daphnia pulicaria]|uniref:acid-sensing ion channel 1B-like n=1 Tax=Daphnia pulicaria TaxID=35523 RepID=UPI001EEA68A1|nr:acid-sensing ion channel 1B-like [Daphnia pulicaria]